MPFPLLAWRPHAGSCSPCAGKDWELPNTNFLSATASRRCRIPFPLTTPYSIHCHDPSNPTRLQALPQRPFPLSQLHRSQHYFPRLPLPVRDQGAGKGQHSQPSFTPPEAGGRRKRSGPPVWAQAKNGFHSASSGLAAWLSFVAGAPDGSVFVVLVDLYGISGLVWLSCIGSLRRISTRPHVEIE